MASLSTGVAAAGLPTGVSAGLGRLAATAGRRAAALGVLAALWESLPRLRVVDPTFLTPLSEVLVAWWDLLLSGELLDHTQASLIRSLAGFALAIVVAIPPGLLIGWYKPVADLLNPVLGLLFNQLLVRLERRFSTWRTT
ncbi:hypothetical protein ABZV14_36340 [Streptosporangium canum]|uniref:ABC transporter permease n=1 Tax=Streptosporangium canum TaxID=324952 RepID=UPI0033AE01BD